MSTGLDLKNAVPLLKIARESSHAFSSAIRSRPSIASVDEKHKAQWQGEFRKSALQPIRGRLLYTEERQHLPVCFVSVGHGERTSSLVCTRSIGELQSRVASQLDFLVARARFYSLKNGQIFLALASMLVHLASQTIGMET